MIMTFSGALASAGAPDFFSGPGDTLRLETASSQTVVLPLDELSPRQLRRLNRVRSIKGFGENKKLTAVLLAVTLGTFGVHRLYLGTRPLVPVVYTITLGGGLGILPLTDIVAILATPDLSRYENNDKVIMWIDSE